MRKNAVLAKLRAGQPTYGLWLGTGSTLLAEEAAHAGLDWALIDTQHGYWSNETILSTLQILSHTETVPLARVAENDPALIGRLLDTGAFGVVVPMVNTREDAQRAVASVRYPPQGSRSAGGSRLQQFGSDYFLAANPEIFLAVMIETVQALGKAEEILSVPGIDCCFIGPTDLALDMGTFGQPSDRHTAAIQSLVDICKRLGMPLGIYCPTLENVHQRTAQGFQFMNVGSDMSLFQRGLNEVKQELPGLIRP
ncbi:MAG: 2,4-dihydroxyhept-2-ene-1,7-dioic acid aldolase [Chloroflexi bacterium]|nr:2,4-dihydroxyhept-2-ene-1,7-dioic acid aldolase [Chloroflexota bacterium]